MAYDRLDRRAEEALSRPGNRVALFVDYENIRRSLEHHFDPSPSPQILCEKLYDLASRFGHVLIANVYADWSIAGPDAREFRRRQIEPRLVLTKENGDDRTDITMSLDALETLDAEPPIDVYVIASGDSDFHDLLHRLRRRGRRIVVTGVRSDTGRELIRGCDRYYPLEEAFTLPRLRQATPVEWETYDWTPFVRLIRDLDRKLTFVGLRYVATKVLNPHNCGLSDRGQKQELLNRAIDQQIIVPYQVENIEEGGEPVSACRLNSEHPLVSQILVRLEEAEASVGEAQASDAPPADAPPSMETSLSTGGAAEAAPVPPIVPSAGNGDAGAPPPEVPATEVPPAEVPVPVRTSPARFHRAAADSDDLGRPGESS